MGPSPTSGSFYNPVVFMLKKTATLLLFISTFWAPVFCFEAGSPIKLSEDLVIEPIENGVYVVVHRFPWPCNSLLVRIDKKNIVWIDTPCESQATKLVVEWIRKICNKPEIIEINTGFHQDNLGGNEYLINQKIPVYGPDLTAKLITKNKDSLKKHILDSVKNHENQKYYRAYQKLKFKAPERLFKIDKGLSLKIGDELVEVYYPGPSHTLDNTVVYFHKRKIMFGGCMIKSLESKKPGYTADADMKQWPKSLRNVLNKYAQSRIVVPGHGESGDIRLIKHTIELLDRANRNLKD